MLLFIFIATFYSLWLSPVSCPNQCSSLLTVLPGTTLARICSLYTTAKVVFQNINKFTYLLCLRVWMPSYWYLEWALNFLLWSKDTYLIWYLPISLVSADAISSHSLHPAITPSSFVLHKHAKLFLTSEPLRCCCLWECFLFCIFTPLYYSHLVGLSSNLLPHSPSPMNLCKNSSFSIIIYHILFISFKLL